MSERKGMHYLPPRKNRYPAGNPSVADPKRQLRFEGEVIPRPRRPRLRRFLRRSS